MIITLQTNITISFYFPEIYQSAIGHDVLVQKYRNDENNSYHNKKLVISDNQLVKKHKSIKIYIFLSLNCKRGRKF